MPKLRSLDLTSDVQLWGYSIAAVAQLTALTRLSLSVTDAQHWQNLTRLSSLSSLESLCLGLYLGSGQVLQVTGFLILFHPRTRRPP